MTGRVDYQIEKFLFTEAAEPERLTRQWAEVLEECREQQAGAEERLRLALLNVDYVTSFELPFRLLLTRAPQLIDGLRKELQLSQKNVLFNGKRFGCVYSLKMNLDGIPDEFNYHLKTRIQRSDSEGGSEVPYRQIAQQVKAPRERLKLALENGLAVTALDGLFWFGIQRIAADVQRLRKTGMRIVTSDAEVFDTLTKTTRRIPVYRLEGTEII
ncbi:DNA-binding protein [Enterobacter cloacae subsp. cloacae]|uniref:helix-turn-helix domain-containing protein n=1 Tax=Enterobacter cloacae TaxID=550 RepID=UPI00063AB8D0|nr:helix-turn-helix domain-containing protein [Enterobacter cloacae]KLG14131.1 DNA-binding protein [Enterobacter cloacae subsp. cloacae]OXU38974.1 DNA-binding protein [Enterobacter cloacae subsp. cloacae]